MSQIFYGIVEDRNDPLKLGRVKVRVAGLHTHDINDLPTADLPWAQVLQRTYGGSEIPQEGSEVVVQFVDYPTCQYPIVMGFINTIPQDKSVFVDVEEKRPLFKDLIAPQGRSIPKTFEESTGGVGCAVVLPADSLNEAVDLKTETQLSLVSSPSSKESLMSLSMQENAFLLGSGGALADRYTDVGKVSPSPWDVVLRMKQTTGSTSSALSVISGSYLDSKLRGKVPNSLMKVMNSTITDFGISALQYMALTSEPLSGVMGALNSSIGALSVGANAASLLANSANEMMQVGSQALSIGAGIKTMNFGSVLGYASSMSPFSTDSIKSEAKKEMQSQAKSMVYGAVESALSDMKSAAVEKLGSWSSINEHLEAGESISDVTFPAAVASYDALVAKIQAFDISALINNVISSIQNFISSIVEKITNFVVGICQYAKAMILNMITNIKTLIATITKMISNLKIDEKFQQMNAMVASVATAQVGRGYASSNYIENRYNGNMNAIREVGASEIDGSYFKEVGEGNTPPINGAWGGPNSRGSDAVPETPEPTNKAMFPCGVNRDLNVSLPSEVYGNGASQIVSVSSNNALTGEIVHGCWSAISVGESQKIINALTQIGITNPERQIDVFGIMARETGAFSQSAKSENLNYTSTASILRNFRSILLKKGYSTEEQIQELVGNPEKLANVVYGGRYGNNNSGDGWKYRGRGYVQLTFKDNYSACGKKAFSWGVIDNPSKWLANPDSVLKTEDALWSSIAYLVVHGATKKTDLRGLCGCVSNVTDDQYNKALYYRNQLATFFNANKEKSNKLEETKVAEANGIDSFDRKYTKNSEHLKAIYKNIEKYGITTKEAQASYLAIVGALCDFVPTLEDYQYSSIETIKQEFPRTFQKDDSSGSLARKYLNWTESREKFFGFVYDTANDGQSIGNTKVGDGALFFGAGLIPIYGRLAYERYAKIAESIDSSKAEIIRTGANSLVNDLEACNIVACNVFLDKMKDVSPTAHPQYFYEAKQKFLSTDEQKTKAERLYAHFLGTNTNKLFDESSKTAGNESNPNTLEGINNKDNQEGAYGFADPNKKYPLNETRNKSTVSKEGKGVISHSIVSLKESLRRLGIPTAMNGVAWNQPHSSFGATYPYNHAIETEGGHLFEMDDTPNHERLHLYHKSGTFTEVDVSGTKVSRIVGDGYTIVDRNGFISIDGFCNVTVGGNVNIYCKSDANIQVEGNTEVKCGGNMNMGVAGDFNLAAQGDISMWSNGTFNLQSAKNGHIRTEKNLYVTANGELHEHSTGDSYRSYMGTSNEIVGGKTLELYCSGVDTTILGSETSAISGGRKTTITGNDVTRVLGSLKNVSNGKMILTSSSDINAYAANINTSSDLMTNIFSKEGVLVNGALETTISSVNTVVSATTLLSLTSSAMTSIYAGGGLGMVAQSFIGIDSTAGLFFNSGVGTGVGSLGASANAVAISQSATVSALILANGAVDNLPDINLSFDSPDYATKAVIHGMTPPAKGYPMYPNIEPCSIPEPIGEDEFAIETEDEGATKLAISDLQTKIAQEGLSNTCEGGTAMPSGASSSRIEGLSEEQVANINSTFNYTSDFKLSEHFTLGMMFDGGFNVKHKLRDQCGLTKQEIVTNLSLLCTNVLEKYLEFLPDGINGYGKLWKVTSGYRMCGVSVKGASKVSDHCKGRACDIQIFGRNKRKHYELVQFLEHAVNYDQLLLEYRGKSSVWIHTGYRGAQNRHMAMTMLNDRKYKDGFVLLG